jgi:hypothetical protein
VTAIAKDSAGHTNVSPGVALIATGPPAQIIVVPTNTVSILPTNATVVPYGQQQFAAIVVDALGNPLSPQPAVTWRAAGGTINAGGWFAAGGSVGGPFAVTASNNGLSGWSSVIIASNVNIAPYGIGYTWYNLASSTGNTPQYEAPGINDGDLTSNVSLLAEYDGPADFTNAYEAAGIIWSLPQTITNVVFINGVSAPSGDGSFDAGFQLQFTQDGSAWVPAGPEWTVTPAYGYNSILKSPVAYVYSGGLTTVLGVRCAGMVNTSPTDSWWAYATEVQAYLGVAPPPPLQASVGSNGVLVSWSGLLTNCTLQTATNPFSPSWTTITNTPQFYGPQTGVTLSPAVGQQYFRLQIP